MMTDDMVNDDEILADDTEEEDEDEISEDEALADDVEEEEAI